MWLLWLPKTTSRILQEKHRFKWASRDLANCMQYVFLWYCWCATGNVLFSFFLSLSFLSFSFLFLSLLSFFLSFFYYMMDRRHNCKLIHKKRKQLYTYLLLERSKAKLPTHKKKTLSQPQFTANSSHLICTKQAFLSPFLSVLLPVWVVLLQWKPVDDYYLPFTPLNKCDVITNSSWLWCRMGFEPRLTRV